MKELSVDIGLGSDREFWSWQMISVSVPLLILLCSSHVLLQHLMKSVKVQRKFTSAGGGRLTLGSRSAAREMSVYQSNMFVSAGFAIAVAVGL
jgi:hypothetical protein